MTLSLLAVASTLKRSRSISRGGREACENTSILPNFEGSLTLGPRYRKGRRMCSSRTVSPVDGSSVAAHHQTWSRVRRRLKTFCTLKSKQWSSIEMQRSSWNSLSALTWNLAGKAPSDVASALNSTILTWNALGAFSARAFRPRPMWRKAQDLGIFDPAQRFSSHLSCPFVMDSSKAPFQSSWVRRGVSLVEAPCDVCESGPSDARKTVITLRTALF